MSSRRAVPVFSVVLVALLAACSESPSGTRAGTPDLSVTSTSGYGADQFEATAKPVFTTDGGVPTFRTARTIPYWSSAFTDPTNGVTSPYTMVGTSPYGPDAQTTIPTAIIPFRFVFSDGTVMDGSDDVARSEEHTSELPSHSF